MLGYDFFHASVLTIDRGLIAVSLVALGIACWLGKVPWKPIGRLDLLFLFFIATMALQRLCASVKEQRQPFYRPTSFLLSTPCWLLCPRSTIDLGIKQIRICLGVLALLGFYLSVTAIAEKLELRWAVFPRYIMSPKFEEFLGRARGPLLNPSGNGVLLAIGFSAFLMTIGWVQGIQRRLLLFVIPIFGLGFAATLTRCVWLAGLIPLIGIVLILVPKNVRRPMVAILAMGLIGWLALALKNCPDLNAIKM